MSRFLNGKEASALLAQLLSDRVYAYDNSSTAHLAQTNIWDQSVQIIELDSLNDPLSQVVTSIAERHVTTALLSSQSLLAAIPYLYKLANDQSSTVLHVAADHPSSASSFADFTQVMAVRQSGLAFLSASTVQEAYDLTLVAQWVSLLTATPFLHFFDSKRISHEYASIQTLDSETLLNFIPKELVDVTFKNKTVPALFKQSAYLRYKASVEKEKNEEGEAIKDEELDVFTAFEKVTEELAKVTGRKYAPLEYVGHSEADFVIISMGAGATVVEQTLKSLTQRDPELKVGALKIRLYRPWSDQALLNSLPSTVQRIAVLEPADDYTSTWNPLFLDVVATYQSAGKENIGIVSGQYGVRSEDFTPKYVQAVVNGLVDDNLSRQFEVSTLPIDSTKLQVVPQATEQVIFVGSSSLALKLANGQSGKKYAQVYVAGSATHARLADLESGPLLPSLIQSADAVVLSSVHLNEQDEKAAVEAIGSLVPNGYIITEGDGFSLSAGIKKAAHQAQANIVSVEDIHLIFKNSSLSDVLKHGKFSSIRAPDSWADEQAFSFTEDAASPDVKKTEATVPVEEPYLKMLDQVFGSRLVIANASKASSIWSPNNTQPNSASPEFGYGRLVNQVQERTRLVDYVMDVVRDGSLPLDIVKFLSQWLLQANSPRSKVQKVHEASDLVVNALTSIANEVPAAQTILDKKDFLYTKSNWLIGSDTWAYDFGQSGIQHVITSGDNMNLLIVDTQPYSSEVEREQRKKDIGLYAMNYGSVYVASVALYASYTGVLQALMEADAYQGPSIVLAYLPQLSSENNPVACLKETKICVDNGSWPLYRWNPTLEELGQEIFVLDSQRIKKQLEDFLARENYLTQLISKQPELSNALVSSLESDVQKRHAELKQKARADYARLLSGMNSSNGPPLTVLFGSDNGNAEGVAKKIATRAKAKGLKVKLMAMDDYGDVQELANETNLVIICSTAGQGELPSNAREFWKALNGLIVGDINIQDLRYTVFGMGDSHYWPREEDSIFYNRPGKLLDAKLENLGATRLVALALGDDQDEDGFETGLSAWQSEFWKALGIKDIGEGDEEPAYTDNQMKIDSNYLRGNIAQELVDDSTGGVTEITQKLMKFHGAYVQDDRDIREERKKQGLEKAFSFLVRVRTPGGVSTSEQWLMMDELSEKYGNSTLKLTTRQAYQLHGILKRNLRTTIRKINKVLLSTLAACGDVNRNIMSTAVTEIPEVHEQVQSLVLNLKDALAPTTNAYHEIWLDNSMVAGHAVQDFEPLYGPSYLPRKFKVVVAVPPSNDVDVYAHDLGYVAIVDKDAKKVVGYNVLIGGGMGQTHGNKKTYPRPATLIGYIPAEAAVKIAEATILTQRDHGDRINRKHARFKYTIDDLGVDFIKKEIEERSGVKFEEPKPFYFDNNSDCYGWSKGVGDTWNFTMFIENGRVKDTPEFLCKTGLRELAKFHKGGFRLSPNQHLVISNIPETDLEKTKAHLSKYKLDNTPFSGIRKSAMACVALPTCGLAMAESERYLPELVTKFEDFMEEAGLCDDSIVVRMTGCPNGCARPYLAEIAFVGKAPLTYNMYLGGSAKGERLNKLYRENLKEEDILKEVGPLIKQYALERNEDESFGDWVIRAGYIKRTITGKDFHDL
ncbi:MAG: thiamine diphosphate-binding protein [Benjaminiella poitrasii]|nr:MAG: thiamine diphosphate-binding protein [Benjaminiella poitrasii]